MSAILNILDKINGYLWGPPMLFAIGMTGCYLMCGLRLIPLRKLRYGFGLLMFGHQKGTAQGDITPFKALMTALSGAVGTGNIAGVATAIHLGGPGALLYMWMIALIGMATSYTEGSAAVKYRIVDKYKYHVGGPMYYIKAVFRDTYPLLGSSLAGLYAFFAAIATLSIGNMVQINSIAAILTADFGVDPLLTGVLVMCLVGAVLIGGITRIAQFAGALVPVMILAYLFCGLIVLTLKYHLLLQSFQLIFIEAFEPAAVGGGVLGAGMTAAMRYGFSRGVFSNEAGIGTGAIAHACAITDEPIRQGHIAMLSSFIDTILVCSITGLVILVTQGYVSGETGAVLTGHSFSKVIPGGYHIVTITLSVFAFTTMIGYSFYGEKCAQYLLGDWVVFPYRILWVLLIPLGAVFKLELVWAIADMLMALMMIPNLIGLIALGPSIFKMTQDYWS